MTNKVLLVSGVDSSGRTGLMAEQAAVTRLGGECLAAVTAIAAETGDNILEVIRISTDMIRVQMEAGLAAAPGAVLAGWLMDEAAINTVGDALEAHGRDNIPLVLDPMVIDPHGSEILSENTMATLKRRLLILTELLTVNITEAEALTGMEIRDLDAMVHAAEMLRTLGPKTVLLNGAALPGRLITDLLVTDDGDEIFETARISGATDRQMEALMAGAIAVGIAHGLNHRDAVVRGRALIHETLLGGFSPHLMTESDTLEVDDRPSLTETWLTGNA